MLFEITFAYYVKQFLDHFFLEDFLSHVVKHHKMVKADNPDASRSSLLKSSIKYSEALFTSETVVETENFSY